MTKFIKITDGTYDVLDDDGNMLGTVEQFGRTASLKQWRFRLGGAVPKVLHGMYVAVGSTRGSAVTRGVEFAAGAHRLSGLTSAMWADLLKLSDEYAEHSTEADFRTGRAYRLLGAMDYIVGRLVEDGYDRDVLVRIMHRAHVEDWQVAS